MQNYAFGVHNLHSIRVGVLGASGYSGRELCALIAGHPHFELAFATANAQRGTTLRVRATGRVHEIPLIGADDADLRSADLVFAALPHGASAEWVGRAVADFADHDLVRVVAQDGTQAAGEGEPLLFIDRDLQYARQFVFDGILDGDDLVVAVVDLADRGIQRGGLAAAGGAGDKRLSGRQR